jgi:hypothetical protein
MQLLARNDPGFLQPHTIYFEADTWRCLLKCCCAKAPDHNCLVEPDDNGYSGRVYAYSETALQTMRAEVQEFRRFKASQIKCDNGIYSIDLLPPPILPSFTLS